MGDKTCPVTQEMSPAMLSTSNLAVGTGDSQDQSQSGLLGERVTGMLLMPTRICSFNLLPKFRVEALDELACAID